MLNFGEGSPSDPTGRQVSNRRTWIPATPGKPISTRSDISHLTPDNMQNQLGRWSWQEPSQFPNGLVQEHDSLPSLAYFTPPHDYSGNASLAEMGNAFTYLQALPDRCEGLDGSLANFLAMNFAAPGMFPNSSVVAMGVSSDGRPPIPQLDFGVGNWRESYSAEQMFGSQNDCSSSCQRIGYFSSLLTYDGPDLNLSPVEEADGSPNATSTFQFDPVTPDKAKRLGNSKHSAEVNLLAVESSGTDEGKQQELVISEEKEEDQHNLNKLLENFAGISSSAISAHLEEPKDHVGESDRNIDLNKTPQQKPPKRRKHRPKVIREGKPKRAPKAATTKLADSKDKPTGKRKYVRKNGLQELQSTQADSAGGTANHVASKRKYARKKGLEEQSGEDAEHVGEATNFRAGKRKYVRKKGLEEPTRAGAAKSCRRALNLDLENTGDEGQRHAAGQQREMLKNKSQAFNLNASLDAGQTSNEAYMMCTTIPALQGNQNSVSVVEKEQLEMISGLITANQTASIQIPFSERQAGSLQRPPIEGKLVDNLNVTPREANGRLHQHTVGGVGQITYPEKTDCLSVGGSRQIMSQYIPRSYSVEGGNPKRGHSNIEQTSPCISYPRSHSQPWPEIFQVNEFQSCRILGAASSDTHKRKKIEHETLTDKVGMPSLVCGNDVHVIGSAPEGINDTVNSQFGNDSAMMKDNSKINKFVNDFCVQTVTCRRNLSKQQVASESNSCKESVGETNGSTEICELLSLTAAESCEPVPWILPRTGLTLEDWPQHKTWDTEVATKCQTPESSQFNLDISEKGRMPQEQNVSKHYHLLPAKKRGRRAKKKFSDPIDEIIHRMDVLHLSGRGRNVEKNALVPYTGDGAIVPYIGDGAIVPYEKFYIKKHKPRPKVDLDPETDRIWKLLMGKDVSEGLEGTDEEKEKWWEEERKVFSLRVDSFIARMHLVQGDRRFSKWKGSVVDSVIGVFLTQNVSDHLSSSAFISLASLFPGKSKRNRNCGGSGSNFVVEEPEVHILVPNDITKWQEKLPCYPLQDSTRPLNIEEEVLSSQDSVQSSIIQVNGGAGSCSGSNSEVEDPANDCSLNNSQAISFTDLLTMDDISFDEFYGQSCKSSLSHEGYCQRQQQPRDTENGQQRQKLETPYGLNYSNFNQQNNQHNSDRQEPQNPPNNFHLASSARSKVQEEEVKESASWPSTTSRFTEEKYANCTTEKVGQEAQTMGRTTTEEHGQLRCPQTADPHALTEKQLEQANCQHHHECHLYERNKIHSPNTSVIKHANLGEEVAKGHSCPRQQISNIPNPGREVFDVEERISIVDGQTCLDNKLIEQTSKAQVRSSTSPNAKTSANASTARKGKLKSEKKEAFDWDSLRKQVQADGIKESSEDTMDSLDYEALRRASIKEISEAIKARGMNNMLAERIKEFLDRLVNEHGSTDLEWLRDVPPDKAKDYLLSIRGLGLKSVECVRLLTLHHLAFPVDTNVGRIAVRLGWVPLQPLPESLQLHLLELYPILETVQRYLWPRLCKLDRETLYELHYQMITFGKVFCTKTRPNCNACPLRAECRHFASAFASARLALPGPEEKRITTSVIPSTAERNTGVNHMLLTMPEETLLEGAGSEIERCIPIIEEPATPEQHHSEVIETDIEDAFEEDPDEIPTIKLNMEDFTASLQSYMQTSTELQEGDLSKALVALNPAIASIPVPKLKNVSRLRTEHQVYELPDSHPLLSEMDRREPDDPSPYLLALWAPGETANSIEPPQQQCHSQKPGILCSEKTCFQCNSIREANSQTVRGTLLIPCRTAMRGSFPLNGTYFQVNEVFADHESSLKPIDVPRAWIWNLPRRIVYFGTTVSTIFRGFVCVRGFERKTRAPRPLQPRLHLPASKKEKMNKNGEQYRGRSS
ncbi:hypothetical protein Tsubulata_044787 [Turnera subulata]|uniref:HhH-GPD domain-containing protein n=1 Tax=Turnera subulata TaxID=218843 RepID=A0A9Q0JHD4_9ROSI|nr:hypothetical protein Tsubulata_044787 [Turnera subulata]